MTWYGRIGNHDRSNRTGHRDPHPQRSPGAAFLGGGEERGRRLRFQPARPGSKNPAADPPDPVGALLSITGLGLLLWAIIEAPANGWTSAEVIGAGLASLAVLRDAADRPRGRSSPADGDELGPGGSAPSASECLTAGTV
jgi:hypothetical protein